MLFLTVELVAALAVGFVLGRLWEIRQRLILTEPVNEPSHLIVSGVAPQASAKFPTDDSKLLTDLDRELKALLKTSGAQGQRPTTVASRR